MLNTLRISNYALIREIDISFSEGFNVVTGETGAGKSILLGAMGLILGNRAESEILLDKSRKCIVEAVFDVSNYNLQPFFEDHDIDFDNLCIVRREINPSGKSRTFINDTPCSLEILKDLGSNLVEIHSQHNTVSLFKHSIQLSVLDNWAACSQEVSRFSAMLRQYKEEEAALNSLQAQYREQLASQDYMQFQAEELDKARIVPGEKDLLREELNTLEHAEEIRRELAFIRHLLDGENNDLNVGHAFRLISASLQKLSALSSKFNESSDRFHSLRLELEDLNSQLDRDFSQTELDPERLDAIRQRLDLINHLEFKHNVEGEEALLMRRDEFESQLGGLAEMEIKIGKLKSNLSEQFDEMGTLAGVISSKRQEAAPELARAVLSSLAELNLSEARFKIEIVGQEDFNGTGKDRVRFLFSANPGSEPGELSKIASGGELSRIMLALKANISEKKLLPTIIFDEIDNGISGETASKVGRLMKSLASKMQVISITHQPSIAGYGHSHYLVRKETVDGSAGTRISKIVGNERVETLASMLSGGRSSDASRKAAEELLSG